MRETRRETVASPNRTRFDILTFWWSLLSSWDQNLSWNESMYRVKHTEYTCFDKQKQRIRRCGRTWRDALCFQVLCAQGPARTSGMSHDPRNSLHGSWTYCKNWPYTVMNCFLYTPSPPPPPPPPPPSTPSDFSTSSPCPLLRQHVAGDGELTRCWAPVACRQSCGPALSDYWRSRRSSRCLSAGQRCWAGVGGGYQGLLTISYFWKGNR